MLLITDRTELDEQIEKVFNGVNEEIYRTTQRRRPARRRSTQSRQWLICSLIHKFRGSDDESATATRPSATSSRSCSAKIPADFSAKGNLFVFVDEAHRTQSGKMHDAMKELLPGAMFIGFTGTPLLKTDKADEHRDLRHASSTPTSSTRPSKTASCSTCATRRATSTST